MEDVYRKIAFELEQDEDGYPPDKWETLWATEVEGDIFKLDNIPFYARNVSSEDLVRASLNEEVLEFKELVRSSGNSVFRVYVMEAAEISAARAEFGALGCESELSSSARLFAVEVPSSCSFSPIATLLEEGVRLGRWEYEEACMRHPSEVHMSE